MIEIQDELPLDIRPSWPEWQLQAGALERQVMRSLRTLGVVDVVQQAVILLLRAEAAGQMFLRMDASLLARSPFRAAEFAQWQQELSAAAAFQRISEMNAAIAANVMIVQWQDALLLHRAHQVLCTLVFEVQARIQSLIADDAEPAPPLMSMSSSSAERDRTEHDMTTPASSRLDPYTQNHIDRALHILRDQQLLLIAGGPGTGKTTLAAKLVLALSQTKNYAQLPALRIALIAPTGRAAARLAQVWQAELAKMLDQAIATEVMIQRIGGDPKTVDQILRVGTVHKFWPPGKNLQQGESGDVGTARSVTADVIVVDESSMLSLELINLILTGCNPAAKLMFLGDPGQLPALDLGAPFFDLLDHFSSSHGLLLTKQWRSDDKLQALAVAIQSIERAKASLQSNDSDQAPAAVSVNAALEQLSRYQAPFQSSAVMLQQLIALGAYDRVMHAATPAQALHAATQLKLLTMTRTGASGQLATNAQLEALLVKHYRHESSQRYRGRVLIATKNRYALNVMNGDIGVVFPDRDRQWKVWFEQLGSMQAFDLDLFDDLEPAFAITVHKAQGSEFDSVILLLPDQPPDNSAENAADARLVYTALTRAKKGFRWLGQKSTLAALIASFDQRGLAPSGYWSKISSRP